MLVQHDTLLNHMKTNILLQKNYGYSFDVLEGMLPWERLVYLDIIKMNVEEENIRKRDAINERKTAESLMRKIAK